MKQKTKIKKNLEKITTNSYYSDNERTLRKIGTNIFFYCGFFLSGFILIIVAAILLHKGYSYSGSEDFKNYATASSALVLSNASTSLFVVGALFIFFPIIINLYVIDEIEKVEILKNNVSKNVVNCVIDYAEQAEANAETPRVAAARGSDNSIPIKPNAENLDNFPTMDEE
ncbi:MAG: hypothetical protein K2N92_01190 [Malacoplasma sp.]|nr:hypothetical protein [Malacoplasma sp.]